MCTEAFLNSPQLVIFEFGARVAQLTKIEFVAQSLASSNIHMPIKMLPFGSGGHVQICPAALK